MKRRALFLASVAIGIGGCATVVHGPYQNVRLESDPPGATATISPMLSERGPLFLDPKKEQKITTPAVVRLRRDNSYRVEYSKPGYKIASSKLVSSYDWVWAPVTCSPCEAIGALPTFDLKDRPLPLRFVEAAFYEYPKGFVRGWGRGVRIFSPDALLGTSYKLKPEKAGYFSNWHALGTPSLSTRLEPTGQ